MHLSLSLWPNCFRLLFALSIAIRTTYSSLQDQTSDVLNHITRLVASKRFSRHPTKPMRWQVLHPEHVDPFPFLLYPRAPPPSYQGQALLPISLAGAIVRRPSCRLGLVRRGGRLRYLRRSYHHVCSDRFGELRKSISKNCLPLKTPQTVAKRAPGRAPLNRPIAIGG
jgi:hypothetical protein